MDLDLINQFSFVTLIIAISGACLTFFQYVTNQDRSIQRLRDEQSGLSARYPPNSQPGTYMSMMPSGPSGLVEHLPLNVSLKSMQDYVSEPLADSGCKNYAIAWLDIEQDLQQKLQRLIMVS